MLAPGLLWTALFCLLPILVVLAVSFATRGTYGGVLWEFSLENYRDLLHPLYGRILGQSVLLAAMTTGDRKSTRLNSSHSQQSRMPSSA